MRDGTLRRGCGALFALAALVAAAPAAAQPIVLVCSGWMPVYEDWARPQSQPDPNDPSRVTVTLDVRGQRLDLILPHLGKTTGTLQLRDDAYVATIPAPGHTIGASELSAAIVYLNRYTGQASIMYVRGADSEMLIAFSGNCAPGKPQF